MMIMSNTGSPPLRKWELNSLREVKSEATSNASIAKLAQELIESKEKAKLEGHALGYQEGYANGIQEGMQKGLQESEPLIQEKVNILSNLEVHLSNLLAFARENIAQEILDLALDLTKVLVYKSLQQDPSSILEVVNSCLAQIPILELPAKLLLHPEDAKIIHERQGTELTKQGWKIVEDSSITRGGCRFETGNSLMDATIESRIEKLFHALGKESDSAPAFIPSPS